MDHTIETFVNRLLQEKGISNLSEEVMDELRNDLSSRVENLLNAEILANMPKDSIEEFEKKLDDASDEEVQEFCKKQIPNLDEVVAGALLGFRNIYLTTSAS